MFICPRYFFLGWFFYSQMADSFKLRKRRAIVPASHPLVIWIIPNNSCLNFSEIPHLRFGNQGGKKDREELWLTHVQVGGCSQLAVSHSSTLHTLMIRGRTDGRTDIPSQTWRDGSANLKKRFCWLKTHITFREWEPGNNDGDSDSDGDTLGAHQIKRQWI